MFETNTNADIMDMVGKFDFERFLNPPKDSTYPLGAWLIITDSQCVIGHNDYDGQGYHSDSLRKAFCKILEEDRFSPLVTPSVTQSNYLIGTMMSGPNMTYIIFRLDRLKDITPNQIKLLEKFKNQYDDLVYKRSQELHHSVVIFEHNGIEMPSYNFDTLYNYLNQKDKINEEKVLPPDINIIGQITLEEEKNRVL